MYQYYTTDRTKREAKKDWLADKKMSAGQSVSVIFLFDQSSVYGINATWRARLIAAVRARWCLAHVPVILLGRILPLSDM